MSANFPAICSRFQIQNSIRGVLFLVCVWLRVRLVLYRVALAVRSAAALRSPPGRTNRRLTRNESRYHSGESLHCKEPNAVCAAVIGVMSFLLFFFYWGKGQTCVRPVLFVSIKLFCAWVWFLLYLCLNIYVVYLFSA